MSELDGLIQEFAKLYQDGLKDEVEFAKRILSFTPYPYQTQFLHDGSRKIVDCCGRQVGKTTLAAIKALHYALAKDETLVLIISPGLRQSKLVFDKILEFIETNSAPSIQLTQKTSTRVRFANQSEIVALPCGRNGSTLRGFTADMIILDECNYIPKIVIDSVIRSTTITRPNSRLIMLSTPWTKDHPFHDALTKPELQSNPYAWPSSINPKITRQDLELERKTRRPLSHSHNPNPIRPHTPTSLPQRIQTRNPLLNSNRNRQAPRLGIQLLPRIPRPNWSRRSTIRRNTKIRPKNPRHHTHPTHQTRHTRQPPPHHGTQRNHNPKRTKPTTNPTSTYYKGHHEKRVRYVGAVIKL